MQTLAARILVVIFSLILLVQAGNSADRINQEGRILGPAPTVTTPTLFNTPQADSVISAMQIYPTTNAWNEDVSKRPLLSNSTDMMTKIRNDLASSRRTLRLFTEMNYVLVPDNQPNVAIDFVDYPDESDPSPYPIPSNLPIESYPVETGNLTLDEWQRDINGDGGDRHAIMVKPGAGIEWETWQTLKHADGSWQASNGAKFDLKSNTLRPDGWTSGDAAGLQMFPALVRYDECERGVVEHAMRLVVKISRKTHLYPATHDAGSTTDPNTPAMGQRLRLNKDFVIPATWSKEEKAVAVALKKYGAIVADNGGFFSISICPDQRFPSGCFDNIQTIDVNQFEVVQSTGATEGPRSANAPTCSAGGNKTASVNTALTIVGTATNSTATLWYLNPFVTQPGTVTFGNASSLNTTATFSAVGTYTLMLKATDGGVHTPAYDVAYVTVSTGTPPTQYLLTVNSGSGSGSYTAGASTTITANSAPAGQVFDKWVADSGSPAITDVNSISTTLTMPANAASVTATYKAQTFALTVTSGSGSGSYAAGTSVTITANAAPAGQVFDKWVANSGSPTITNVNNASTTLTMPANAASVTATYKAQTFALTVTSGSGGGSYAAGTSVTITANAAPAGQVFDKWVANSGSPTITDVNASSTTLTMPGNAASVTATYKAQTFVLTVTSGSGSGSYAAGTSVTITANAAPAGQVFDKWVANSGTPTITDVNASSTTLTMPGNAASVTATYKAAPPTLYALTVNSGSGSGSYAAGTSVTITANVAPAGQVFDKWVANSGSPTIANVNNASTTLTMPANAASVTATYKAAPPTLYVLTVNSGSGSGSYAAGTSVTITANAAPAGQVFDKWVANSGSPTIADVNASSTTLTMPANAASVTATYKAAPPTLYALTVNSGAGSGSYAAGTSVTITANAAPAGQVFDKWVANSGSPTIGDVNAASTTLTMPANAASVTATYKAQTFALTVTSGSGSGSYAAGTNVTITANAAPAGQVFDKWVANSGSPTIADVNASSTTLTMPANAASITATYKAAPPTLYALTITSGSGSGSYAAGTSVTITANAAPAGQVFDKWVANSGSPAITDVNATSTTLTMPANAASVTATYKAAPPTLYALTVNSGSGSGSYAAGTSVTITANAAPAGQVFDKWVANFGAPTITNVNSASTTLTMPANAASVTATYKAAPPTLYALTVNSGSGGGSYAAGTSVTITANAAPAGQVFDKWVANSGSPTIADVNASSTTLTMPGNAASVTATYKAQTFALTVSSGSGSGSYVAGATVTITATTAQAGQVFDKWVINSGAPTIANVSSASTTLTMPGNAASVTATYKAAPPTLYALTVNSGSGSGSYAAGTNVTITASAAPASQVFDKWVANAGSPVIANVNSASTTLTMPAITASVTATYKAAQPAGLPFPWKNQDVGTVGLAGTSTAVQDTFTIKGAGREIGMNTDSFQFAYRELTGNGEITARIADFSASNFLATAGVMMRGSTATGSVSIYACSTTWATTTVRRSSEGGYSAMQFFVISRPQGWLRITRESNTFSAFRSVDGVTWTLMSRVNIPMGTTILVGMGVCSHDTNNRASATFDHVVVK